MKYRNFITIPINNSFYGRKPYKIGKLLTLTKDPSNYFDSEAIKVISPEEGVIGYVANSTSTVYSGTISAGRLYDRFEDSIYAMVIFITRSSVIASVIMPEEIAGKDRKEIQYWGSNVVNPFCTEE